MPSVAAGDIVRHGLVFARAALYETDILMLHQGADVDDQRLLRRLRPHLAEHDVAELEKILREQSQRKRFAE